MSLRAFPAGFCIINIYLCKKKIIFLPVNAARMTNGKNFPVKGTGIVSAIGILTRQLRSIRIGRSTTRSFTQIMIASRIRGVIKGLVGASTGSSGTSRF